MGRNRCRGDNLGGAGSNNFAKGDLAKAIIHCWGLEKTSSFTPHIAGE